MTRSSFFRLANPRANPEENENYIILKREAELFEYQVQVICGIQTIKITPKKDRPNKQKTTGVNSAVKDKHKIRGMYQQQKHRAIQEIVLGPTCYCPIEAAVIDTYYRKILSGPEPKCNISDLPQTLWQKNMPSEEANLKLMKDFTSKEIESKLLSKIYNPLSSSRSLGLDRISFENLRHFDSYSNYSRMNVLFNTCLKFQTVPKIWMEFWSVLVKVRNNDFDNSDVENSDMDNENSNIKEWRTVTMQRTISKLFQSLIAARLIVWAKNTKRLSETQKGFLMHNATCESSFILQECKNYAEDEKKSLAVAWLDFTNACDFIPQSAVLHALNKHSVPSSIIEIIRMMLEFSNTQIRVMGDNPADIRFTNVIPILNGLPQGSPISPILLDLVIEPILRDLSSAVSDTFEIYNNKINHYAIPNELTLIVDSPSKLQNLLRLVEKNSKLVGLKFNIHKCSTYHYDGKEKEVKSDKRFLFFGQKLTTLPQEKIEEFFGVKQGLSIGQDCCPSIQEMITSIEDIDNSLLEWYQKLESVLIFIIPRVENFLRGLQTIDRKSLGEAEQLLKDKFKNWLSPDKEVIIKDESIVYHVAVMKQTMKEDMKKSIKYHYLPFMDLFYIMKVIHGLKMLTSQDKIVKTVAFATLTAEVNSLMLNKTKMNVKKGDLAQYLSGELHITNIGSKSLWHVVREATSKLKMKIPLKWQYTNQMQLIIEREDFRANNKKNVLGGKNPTSDEEKLKNTLVEYYIDKTLKMSSDGNLTTFKLDAKKR